MYGYFHFKHFSYRFFNDTVFNCGNICCSWKMEQGIKMIYYGLHKEGIDLYLIGLRISLVRPLPTSCMCCLLKDRNVVGSFSQTITQQELKGVSDDIHLWIADLSIHLFCVSATSTFMLSTCYSNAHQVWSISTTRHHMMKRSLMIYITYFGHISW